MPKLTDSVRDAILQDKANLSNKQLQEKYGVSRSTIQRIKLPDLESRVNEFHKPEVSDKQDKQDFAEQFIQKLDEVQHVQVPKIDRQPIIQKILMNADAFPAHYPFITDRNAFVHSLSDKNPHQLKDLLDTMERTRSTNNLSAQMKQIFFVGSRAAEVLGTKIRLKMDGLTNALMQQQQELDYIFKEMALTYSDTFTKASSPEMRLAMLFGMTALQVDSRNRVREVAEPEEKYEDL